jgi:hypothetical protein
MKKSIFKLITLMLLLSILYACNTTQSKIDSVITKIEKAEGDMDKISTDDWKSLEIAIKNLYDDFQKNKENYSDEQRKEIAKIRGRYIALQIKKGVNEIIDIGGDLKTELESIFNNIIN